MTLSLPVMTLTAIGVVLVVLGLFAAGSIELVGLGILAVAIAGVLEVAGSRRR